MKGIVKWYNARKGYGFITPDDKSEDVFVHAVTLKACGLSKLFTGSEVTFEFEQDEKGKRAKDLKVTKEVKPDSEKEKVQTKSDQKPQAKQSKETKPKKEIEKKEAKPKKEAPKKSKAKPTKKAKPGKKTDSKTKSK